MGIGPEYENDNIFLFVTLQFSTFFLTFLLYHKTQWKVV